MKTLLSALFLIGSTPIFADGNCCTNTPCCMNTCAGEFYIEGSFLYWNAGLNNLYYAALTTTNASDAIVPKDVCSTADLHEPGYSWDPGVRVSLGWRECGCGWDFQLIGTYFQTEAKDKVQGSLPDFSAGVFTFLTPLINPSFSGNVLGLPDRAGTAQAKWKLTFGTLDALAAGRFTPWRCLKLRPNFGLRTAWIKQRLQAEYSPVSFIVLQPEFSIISGDRSVSTYDVHYWGIGFKGGIDFEAAVCRNLSIIGGFGSSLLFGQLKASNQVVGHTIDPGAPTTVNNLSSSIPEKFNKMASDLEADLGLSYGCNLGCVRLTLSASYLLSLWFNQADFANFTFTTPSVTTPQVFLNFYNITKAYSNLVIQGAEVRAGLSF